MDESYSVRDAARVLKRTEPQIRKMLNKGELYGTQDDRGRWQIDRASVNERKKLLEAAGVPVEADGKAEDLAIRLGKEMARRELTSHAQSTLEETIVNLRAELDAERERRIRAEAELEFLRRPILRRLLG